MRSRCRTIFQAVVINRRVTEFLFVKKIRERQRVKPAAGTAICAHVVAADVGCGAIHTPLPKNASRP